MGRLRGPRGSAGRRTIEAAKERPAFARVQVADV
jgi:hypothetical protein